MNAFRVWVRSTGTTCRVRVEGVENTRWLIGRLSQFYMFRQFVPMITEQNDSICTFDVPYNTSLTPPRFEKLLSDIHEVLLLKSPNAGAPGQAAFLA